MGSKIPVLDLPSVGLNVQAPQTYEPHATPRTDTAGVVGGALNDLTPVLLHIQDAADVERVNVEMKSLREWKKSYVDDPATGVLSKQRENARGIFQETDKQYDTQADLIKQRLANDNQRRIFDGLVERDKASVLNAVRAHESNQITIAGNAAIRDQIDDLSDNMARFAAYNDDVNGVNEDTQRIAELVTQTSPLMGWDAKAVAKDEISKAHERAVNSIIGQKNYALAAKYLQAHRFEMKPDAVVKWSDHLEKAAKPAEDMAIERNLWAKVEEQERLGQPGYRFNEELAQSIIDEQPAEMVGRVRAQLHTRIEDARKAQDRADIETIGKIDTDQILKSGRVDRSSQEFLALDHNGQSVVLRREEAHQRAKKSAAAEDRRIQNEINNEFLWIYKNNVTEMDDATRTTWTGKSEVDLAKEYPDVDRTTINRALAYRNGAMQKERIAGLPYLHEVRAGLAKGLKPYGSNVEKAGMDAITTWYIEQPTPPTKEEVNKKAAELGALYERPGFHPITRYKPGAALTEEERGRLKVAPVEDQKYGLGRSKASGTPVPSHTPTPPTQKAVPKDWVKVIRNSRVVAVPSSQVQPGEQVIP